MSYRKMKFKMKFIKIKINESNRLNDYKSRTRLWHAQRATKHKGAYRRVQQPDTHCTAKHGL